MSTMNPQLAQAVDAITKSDKPTPQGRVEWMHFGMLMSYGLGVDVDAENQWQVINDHCSTVHLRDAETLFQLFEDRAWTAGYLGLTALAEKLWKNVSASARGAFITGLSRNLNSTSFADWMANFLADTTFDSRSVVETCCNAIRHKRTEILKALLNRPDLATESVERYTESESQRGWERELLQHSLQFYDVLLECAVRSQNVEAASLALERGASPNIPCWKLERRYNERFSLLSFAINEGGGDLVGLLLEHGADVQGLDYEGRNKPLYSAWSRCRWALVDQLLSRGARFEGGDLGADMQSAGGETQTIAPRQPYFGCFKADVEWAEKSIGRLVPLAPLQAVPWFYDGSGQVGEHHSFLGCLFRRDDLDNLRKYEPLGLPVQLTVPDLANAIKADAFDCLWYVLGKLKALPQTYFRIRRHKPDFGIRRIRPLDYKPDVLGLNVVANFDTHGQEPLELPDGSRLYVNLDSVAPPGHSHGTTDCESFWFEEVICQYRRRGDHIVVRKPRRRWTEMPFNGSPNLMYCHEFLPMVREVEGKFIWAGIDLLFGVSSSLGPASWAPVYEKWQKSAGRQVRAMIFERAKAQMLANAPPPYDDDLNASIEP